VALPVNSRHHQAINRLAPGLRVTAQAPDGVIEAVEAQTQGHTCILGLQWHPEGLLAQRSMRNLFQRFCALCAESRATP